MTEAEALVILYGTPDVDIPTGVITHTEPKPAKPTLSRPYWSDRFRGACSACNRQSYVSRPIDWVSDTCLGSCHRCGEPVFLHRQTMAETLETK